MMKRREKTTARDRRGREKRAGAKEKKKKDEDVDFNEMWNVVYKLEEALQPIMPSNEDSGKMCPKLRGHSCPSGHYLKRCGSSEGYLCEQCDDTTFQPNENWLGDNCRLRKNCKQKNMDFKDPGSTVRDSDCKCDLGFHFPNMDQRSCVPNSSCRKGYAPGIFGKCENCLSKSGYSDETGRAKKCKILTNCEKQNRCTLVKSNGMFDNICGPIVTDLNTCEAQKPSSSDNTTTIAIACGVAGFLVLVVIVVVVFILIFSQRRRRRHKPGQQLRALTVEEADELRQRIVKECDRNPTLCKKVLATSCSFIEERIDRQRWTLAQELFRPHSRHGMYELLVEKYKDSQAKYTVNGYLQEFKVWKGESKEAVAEIFRCLHQVKRDDIVNEICATLRTDVGFQIDNYSSSSNRQKKSSYHTPSSSCCPMCFCCGGSGNRNAKKKSASSSTTTTTTTTTSSSSAYPRQHYHPHPYTSPSPSTTVMVEHREAETKLLAIASDDIEEEDDDNVKGGGGGGGGGDCGSSVKPPGTFYLHPHPSPSAPALEEYAGAGGAGLPDLDRVKYSRQYSQPVQATS